MGNCSSCVTSDNQINDYGRLENALHITSPIFDANSNNNNWNHHKIGSVHSQVGAKGVNQDAALLYQGYGTKEGALCGVFDGHGLNGHVVSKFVRNQLPTSLLHPRKFMQWQDTFVTSFKAMDKEVKLLDNVDLTFSGSTAVVVVKQGDDLAIANLGDSRAVLGKLSENGIQAIQLTVDLKPGVPAETERIRNSKGRVFALSNEQHIERVWLPEEDIPGLAMSRAFGDFDMKSHGIIVTPVVSHHHLSSDDLFVVLATDGVWDVLSNDEVVSIVWSVKNKEMAAKAVVDEANAAWKQKFPRAKVDDCTVVCLFFHDKDDS
ncbi:hypothetical protein RND81_03G144100 [Saponaria officinalis]|uniref:PPM-type phosphatase domain-containing protein n=1 Tax=Saponaria officinalis TaxID=3572 RepID=A0AAW1M0A1_SAPOF